MPFKDFQPIWSRPLRVLVCGQRTYTRYEAVLAVVKTFQPGSVIIHGAARGADMLADRAAHECGLEVLPFLADWKQLGRSAGVLRNRRMLLDGKPELIVAFYRKGGRLVSRGTNHMVALAEQQGLPVLILEDKE